MKQVMRERQAVRVLGKEGDYSPEGVKTLNRFWNRSFHRNFTEADNRLRVRADEEIAHLLERSGKAGICIGHITEYSDGTAEIEYEFSDSRAVMLFGGLASYDGHKWKKHTFHVG